MRLFGGAETRWTRQGQGGVRVRGDWGLFARNLEV
jgi:hypothetical protein